jgi:uncharacterized protein YkwD
MMRTMATGAAALLLAACMGTVAIGSAPGTGAAGGSAGSSGGSNGGSGGSGGSVPTVAEMARLVNAHRQARGCPALIWLDAAAAAAQAHSADMARRDYFDHVSPEGQKPWDRLTARGVSYRLVAENIAFTPERSARETLQGWIESADHRENLENCAYTHHGIGLQDAYWTHVFVTPLQGGE